jgi:hypothetical protein
VLYFILFFVFVLCIVSIVAYFSELSILDCLFECSFSNVYPYDNTYCDINLFNCDISSLCICIYTTKVNNDFLSYAF